MHFFGPTCLERGSEAAEDRVLDQQTSLSTVAFIDFSEIGLVSRSYRLMASFFFFTLLGSWRSFAVLAVGSLCVGLVGCVIPSPSETKWN